MELSIHALCLLASLSLYCLLLSAEVSEGQYVPGRCECYNTKKRVRGQLSDLRVIPQSHTCIDDQIIVVMKKTKSQEEQAVCVDPTGKLGKQLFHCWMRAKKNGVDVKRCLKRKRTDQGTKDKTHRQKQNSGDLNRIEEGQHQSRPKRDLQYMSLHMNTFMAV